MNHPTSGPENVQLGVGGASVGGVSSTVATGVQTPQKTADDISSNSTSTHKKKTSDSSSQDGGTSSSSKSTHKKKTSKSND